MRLRCMLQLLLSLEQQLCPKGIWRYPPDERLQNINPVVLLLLRIGDEGNVVSAELEQESMLTGAEPFIVIVAVRRPTRRRALDSLPTASVDRGRLPQIYARDRTPRHVVIRDKARSNDPQMSTTQDVAIATQLR